jgi:hypothetical protein
VKGTTGDAKRKFFGTLARVLRRRAVVAALVSVCVFSLFSLSSSAPTDIDDIVAAIEEVFTDAVAALRGDEFESQTLRFAYKPPVVDSVHVEVTVLGFAFCDPPDPWVAPDPTPTFPFNVYGCENVATITPKVSQDVTSADILIEVSDFFLDIEYERDETPACLECCPSFPCIPIDPCGTVRGEGYLLTSGSIAARLTLTRVGTCLEASIVPGSVEVTLVPKRQGFRVTPGLTADTCVEGAWDLFSPLFFDMLNETASKGLEEILVSQMGSINEVLCPLTPVEESTWGHIKALFD